jgi:hypothetical protein
VVWRLGHYAVGAIDLWRWGLVATRGGGLDCCGYEAVAGAHRHGAGQPGWARSRYALVLRHVCRMEQMRVSGGSWEGSWLGVSQLLRWFAAAELNRLATHHRPPQLIMRFRHPKSDWEELRIRLHVHPRKTPPWKSDFSQPAATQEQSLFSICKQF